MIAEEFYTQVKPRTPGEKQAYFEGWTAAMNLACDKLCDTEANLRQLQKCLKLTLDPEKPKGEKHPEESPDDQ